MSWLWKGDTSSPQAFEKALQKLSAQISSSTVSLDKARQRQRRAKALWTLYTSLAYLVSVLILVLVVGPQDWDIYEYGGLVGAPLIIYGVRQAITQTFGWSIARQQRHVTGLEKQREEKIKDLKKATRYDSTQELLSKYGGTPSRPRQEEQAPKKSDKIVSKNQVQRTGIPPPPTANIPGRVVSMPVQTAKAQQSPNSRPQSAHSQATAPYQVPLEEPGFAPNAFPSQPSAPPTRTAYEHTSHWYDRILDVMLGEDETLAKNRLVMLCANCKMVNGQAPPGVKTPEELGRWRCQACHEWNGVESSSGRNRSGSATSIRDKNSNIAVHKQETVHEEDEKESSNADVNVDNEKASTGARVGTPDTVSKRVTRSSGKVEHEELD